MMMLLDLLERNEHKAKRKPFFLFFVFYFLFFFVFCFFATIKPLQHTQTTRLLTLHSFIRLDFNQTYKTIRILNNNTIVSFHHHTITRNNYNHIPPKFHTQFNCHHFHYYPFSEAILFILIQLLNSNCT